MNKELLSFPLLCAIALPCAAQIPNGSFENWSDVGGYEDPDGWYSFNSLSFPTGSVLTCEEGTPGAVGDSHVIVSSQDVPGIGIVPGTLYSTADVNGPNGFPHAVRSGALVGQWYYNMEGTDQGYIQVNMSRWNPGTQQREIIGVGVAAAMGSVVNWDEFIAPITYIAPGDPDTALIYIYSSVGGGAAGSTMHVDDLGFSAASGMDHVDGEPVFELFPSPATDMLHIRTNAAMSAITFFDATGREVRRIRPTSDLSVIDVSDLPAGVYMAQLRSPDGRVRSRTFEKD